MAVFERSCQNQHCVINAPSQSVISWQSTL